MFCTDANKLQMAGYKLNQMSKVIQNLYASIKKITAIWNSYGILRFS